MSSSATVTEADACANGGGERLRVARPAQRLRGEEVLGGVKLEARRDRRQLRQPLDRFDTGADVAFPFSSGDPSRGVRRDRVGATS